MKKRLFMFSVMLLSIMQVALAQVTTAALTGKVTLDNTNEEVIGAQWKFSGDKHKSLQVDTERTFHQRYPLVML